MSRQFYCFCLLLIPFSAAAARAQTTRPGVQGPAVLAQVLNAVGGPMALAGIQDFTATGTITYFWAGEPVQGTATVRGRGSDQFRLDSNLPEGTRSYAVSHGVGALKDSSGKVNPIPSHNTLNAGVLSFPFLTILKRLNDPATIVTDMGLAPNEAGGQLHQVRVQRQFSPQEDPDGTLAKLAITDYFVDPTTNLLAKMVDSTHPVETLTISYSHEIDYESYTNLSGVNGVQVPTLVREKIAGQTILEIHLSGISFNTGLTDFDFAL